MNVLFQVKILWDLNPGQVIPEKLNLQTTICGRHEIYTQIGGQCKAHYKDDEGVQVERFADNSHVKDWNNNILNILGSVKHTEINFVWFFVVVVVVLSCEDSGSEVRARPSTYLMSDTAWISPLKTPQSRLTAPSLQMRIPWSKENTAVIPRCVTGSGKHWFSRAALTVATSQSVTVNTPLSVGIWHSGYYFLKQLTTYAMRL